MENYYYFPIRNIHALSFFFAMASLFDLGFYLFCLLSPLLAHSKRKTSKKIRKQEGGRGEGVLPHLKFGPRLLNLSCTRALFLLIQNVLAKSRLNFDLEMNWHKIKFFFLFLDQLGVSEWSKWVIQSVNQWVSKTNKLTNKSLL